MQTKRNAMFTIAVFIMLLLPAAPTSTAASRWIPCEPNHFGPTAPNRIFVDVYMNVNTPAILGLPTASIQTAISEATNIWNEQVSGAVVLRWAGVTTYGQLAGCIVVTARNDVCTNAGMYAENYALSGSRIIGSVVEIRKYTDGTASDATCVAPISQIPWTFAADDGFDMVSKLMHEFGHGVGFIGHPLEKSCLSTSSDLTSASNQESIMDSDGVAAPARSIRAFDKHRFADMYSQRSLSSSLLSRFWNSSTMTWGAAFGSIASYVAHRPGASQGGTAILLEWFNRGASGTRGVRKASYSGALFDITDFGTDQGNQSEVPGAIAINPSTGTAIAVYQRRPLTALRYGANSAAMEICYRFSSNSGQAFGGPKCIPSNRSTRYGIGVGFDPGTSRFIISYSRDSDGSLVMLTFGSSSENDGLSPTAVTLANKSLHGASIACRGLGTPSPSGNECRLAYQDKVTYEVRTLNVSIDLFGQVQPGPTYGLGYLTSDMPSIAFWTNDQTYRLAFKSGHYAIYSYKSLPTQTSWIGTGDIVNNYNVAVSSPVIGTTPSVMAVFYVQQW
jgi:hypothetical protein